LSAGAIINGCGGEETASFEANPRRRRGATKRVGILPHTTSRRPKLSLNTSLWSPMVRLGNLYRWIRDPPPSLYTSWL